MTDTMPKSKFSQETLNRAAEMREAGKSYGQIALATGMSVGMAYWHCLSVGAYSPKNSKKANVGPRVVKRGNHVVRRFTPEEDAILVQMSIAGKSQAEMCRRLNRKNNSVKGRLMTLARHDAWAEDTA